MKKLDKPVLAEGEVTGHAHKLEDETTEVFDDGQTRTFNLKKPTVLRHEEHKPIELPTMEYESGKAVEYDHFVEEAREVAD